MGYPKFKKQRHVFLWDIDATNTSADSHTATGVIPIFSAPASCLIHKVQAHVLTLVAGSTAEELGDGTDVNGFLEDGFAAATGVYPLYSGDVGTTFAGVFNFDQNAGGTDALDVDTQPKEKLYGSADTIDYKITGTATAGKIRFIVDFTVLA